MEPVDQLLQCVDPSKDRELWVKDNKTGEIRPVDVEIWPHSDLTGQDTWAGTLTSHPLTHLWLPCDPPYDSPVTPYRLREDQSELSTAWGGRRGLKMSGLQPDGQDDGAVRDATWRTHLESFKWCSCVFVCMCVCGCVNVRVLYPVRSQTGVLKEAAEHHPDLRASCHRVAELNYSY